MRSGLVSTPVQGPFLFITLRCSPYQHTDRPLAERVIFLSQKVCTLIDKVRCVALLDGSWSKHQSRRTFTGNRKQYDTTGALYVGYG